MRLPRSPFPSPFQYLHLDGCRTLIARAPSEIAAAYAMVLAGTGMTLAARIHEKPAALITGMPRLIDGEWTEE